MKKVDYNDLRDSISLFRKKMYSEVEILLNHRIMIMIDTGNDSQWDVREAIKDKIRPEWN